MRYKWIFLCIAIVASLYGCEKEENPVKDEMTVTREIFAMDTYMSLSATGEKAEEALDESVNEILRLDELLSVGKEESEIYTINNSGSAILSDDTAKLIETSIELYSSTKGAFDITIFPLMETWGFTTKQYTVPDKSEINSILKNVSASKIEYNGKEKTINLPKGVRVDLGGIAKGYTSNRIMEIFEEYSIESGMVSLGGNVQLYGRKPDGSLWKIAVENPKDEANYVGVLQIEDKAVISSGGYERYFEENGVNYHHILDPNTGYPARSGLISVTIVSEDGTMADGLSTALFVMGKQKALEYWKNHSEKFDAILVEEDGNITITKGLEGIFSSDYEFSVEE